MAGGVTAQRRTAACPDLATGSGHEIEEDICACHAAMTKLLVTIWIC